MKIILWVLLALFLIGNAFFILPYHYSEDKVTSSYYINYKKDSALLRNVFPDTAIQLKLNMPPGYEILYRKDSNAVKKKYNPFHLFVNVSVFHNLDFTALSFPFYKLTSFNGAIPFYSIIKASNAPDMDSTALIGNIVINGKISVKGICTPEYARTLVEKHLAVILKKEMDKIEEDINRRPPADTIATIIIPQPLIGHPSKKKIK